MEGIEVKGNPMCPHLPILPTSLLLFLNITPPTPGDLSSS